MAFAQNSDSIYQQVVLDELLEEPDLEAVATNTYYTYIINKVLAFISIFTGTEIMEEKDILQIE